MNREKPPLAMASWALRLEHDKAFKRWYNSNLIGMSLAGMSDLEHEVMTSWCKANGAIHITKRHRFEEFLHHSFHPSITNIPDDTISLEYMEEEVCVVGSVKFIAKALKFSKSWPMRKHTCYVTNTDKREINKAMRGSNYRMVRLLDITQDAWLVSTDDKDKLFQLWIKS